MSEAEEVCRAGLVQHPMLVTGEVALGRALLESGRLREALDVFMGAAKANPEHSDAFRWLGEVALGRGDRDRARAILEYAEELAPFDGRVIDLLDAAGGTPRARAPRPQTDFEHTRLADAQSLADQVADTAAPSEESTGVVPMPPSALAMTEPDPPRWPGLGTFSDEPTVVDRAGSLQAWRAAEHSGVAASPIQSGSAPGALPEAHGISRRRIPVWVTLVLLVAGGGGGYWWLTHPAPTPARDPRVEMQRAISRGSLRGLRRARDLGAQLLATSPADGEVAGRLVFVNALLLRDHGVGSRTDVERATAKAEATGPPSPVRAGLIETARALVALDTGELEAARGYVAKAAAAMPEATETLLVTARVRTALGDLEGARVELRRLLAMNPDFAPAVTDWAALWIELGDPGAAASSLRMLIGNAGDHARARLLLAEAERALGERSSAGSPVLGCAQNTTESPLVRMECALYVAAEKRLAGEHAAALEQARTFEVEPPSDARLLAQASLMLALLGEVDAAAGLLENARRLAHHTSAPLAWADIAVRLGRGETVEPSPVLERPTGPERRLVAARAAYAHGGAPALAALLLKIPPGLVALDNDLQVLAVLARSGGPSETEQRRLKARADNDDPVAALVLGRLAERAGDARAAARHFGRAIAGHGDACVAAGGFLNALKTLERPAVEVEQLVSLKERNAQCPAIAGF